MPESRRLLLIWTAANQPRWIVEGLDCKAPRHVLAFISESAVEDYARETGLDTQLLIMKWPMFIQYQYNLVSAAGILDAADVCRPPARTAQSHPQLLRQPL